MQITPFPMKLPSRMLEPPGTMRMPLSGPKRFTGNVALSNMGRRTGSGDISTTVPILKPSRMPFLTQMFTRQPAAALASGSAERMAPSFRACLKRANNAKCSSVNLDGFSSNSFSISVCMHAPAQHPARLQNSFDFCPACFGRSRHRQAPHGLQQSHHGHGRLHRLGVGFNEVHFHQREPPALILPCAREIACQSKLRKARHLRRDFVCNYVDDSAAPESDERNSYGVV